MLGSRAGGRAEGPGQCYSAKRTPTARPAAVLLLARVATHRPALPGGIQRRIHGVVRETRPRAWGRHSGHRWRHGLHPSRHASRVHIRLRLLRVAIARLRRRELSVRDAWVGCVAGPCCVRCRRRVAEGCCWVPAARWPRRVVPAGRRRRGVGCGLRRPRGSCNAVCGKSLIEWLGGASSAGVLGCRVCPGAVGLLTWHLAGAEPHKPSENSHLQCTWRTGSAAPRRSAWRRRRWSGLGAWPL